MCGQCRYLHKIICVTDCYIRKLSTATGSFVPESPLQKNVFLNIVPDPQERILFSDIPYFRDNYFVFQLSGNKRGILPPIWTTWNNLKDRLRQSGGHFQEFERDNNKKKAKLEKFYTVRPSVKSSVNFWCRPHYILLWHSLDTKKSNTQIHPNRHKEVVKSKK